MSKRVLFIGGNGNISWWCLVKALKEGYEVWALNRGITDRTRPEFPPGVKRIICDIRNLETVKQKLKDLQFDCVCDFICYSGIQAVERISLFEGRTSKYFVISSEAVYSREKNSLPFTEDSKQYNLSEVGGYIKGKIESEIVFKQAFKKTKFPSVIIRPHNVYSTLLLTPVGRGDFTQAKLILEGKPLLMLGDGNNLVAPLHAEDFANAFVPLFTNQSAVGESFQIANTKSVTWNETMKQFLEVLSASDRGIYNLPPSVIDRKDLFTDKQLIRQQIGNNVFDCSKIKKAVPGWSPSISYSCGIKRTLFWLDEFPNRKRVDPSFERKVRLLYEEYCKS